METTIMYESKRTEPGNAFSDDRVEICRAALDQIRGDQSWRKFANELCDEHSISHAAVHAWFQKGSVPAHWVAHLIRLAYVRQLVEIKPRHLNSNFDL